MKQLLLQIKTQVEERKAIGFECLDIQTLRGFEQKYQEILGSGFSVNISDATISKQSNKRGRKKLSSCKELVR